MAIEYRGEQERLIAEQAVLTYRAVFEAGAQAPHGQGMDAMEGAILDHGRELLRQTLQHAASAHIEAQKKGRPRPAVAVASRGGSRVIPTRP